MSDVVKYIVCMSRTHSSKGMGIGIGVGVTGKVKNSNNSHRLLLLAQHTQLVVPSLRRSIPNVHWGPGLRPFVSPPRMRNLLPHAVVLFPLVSAVGALSKRVSWSIATHEEHDVLVGLIL
jgi:hypothetical protein